MANKKYLEQRLQAEREKKYLSDRKKLRIFPLISLVIVAVLLLTMLATWTGLYNLDSSSYDGEVTTGYQCVAAALSDDYTSADQSRFGTLSVIFYPYAPSLVRTLCLFSVIVLFVMIGHLLTEVFALITNKQGVFNILAIVFAVTEAVFFILCYDTAISMTGPVRDGYCGNPACTVKSSAIIPGLIAILSLAVPIFTIIRERKVKAMLSAQSTAK